MMIPMRWPALAVVIPTFNEKSNIRPLFGRLDAALQGIDWEAIFVDDDSPDGTAGEVASLAAGCPRVRLLHRIGRRGLSSACIEGILSSFAPIVAVIDADLQHDESRLGAMFQALQADGGLQLVIGSRNLAGGSATGGFSRLRNWGSGRAAALARWLLGLTVSDPMSGFFMVRRSAFIEVAVELQSQGFKILADMLSSARGRWKVVEMPYDFRPRIAGASKMDSATVLEFLGLIVARLSSGLLPIRLVLFGLVGLTGVFVQLAAVRLAMAAFGETFVPAQALGVLAAMTSNFVLNNRFTWREQNLHGRAFLRGLLSFYIVCSIGVLINVGVADAVYRHVSDWMIASLFGTLVGAVWNFWASLLFTWRAR